MNDHNSERVKGYSPEPVNPPMFNVPGVILALSVLMIGIQFIANSVMSDSNQIRLLLTLSFIPAAYTSPVEQLYEPLARWWSPVSYAFLHGDWPHLLVNLVWMLAFGSAIARRFGNARFLVFFAVSAAAGAAAHYLFHPGEIIPVVGASAAISGFMGAAIRFAFSARGMVKNVHEVPALSLAQSLQNRSVMIFIGIWFAVNWFFGSGVIAEQGAASIAWEAHMGGFLFGWLAFSLFDRKP